MIEIERGLIHPADAKAALKKEGATSKEERPAGLSAGLVEDLTAHRTAALRVELSRNPAVALAMTVHALAASLLYPREDDSCLEVKGTSAVLERHIKEVGDSPAHAAMSAEETRWRECLQDVPDLLAWCLAAPQEELLDLLAYLAALTINAVQTKQGRSLPHDRADSLAAALSLDMAQWWTPSSEGFFERLPKAALMQAVDEANVGAVNFGSVKKAEAARLAANALKGSGWLPEPLRVPV